MFQSCGGPKSYVAARIVTSAMSQESTRAAPAQRRQAMYRAKRGTRPLEMFDRPCTLSLAKLSSRTDLRAPSRSEFRLQYQP